MMRVTFHDQQRGLAWWLAHTEPLSDQMPPGAQAATVLDESDNIVAVILYAPIGSIWEMHFTSDGTKRWATRATLREIFDYAFNFLGLARVSGFIASGNAAALKAALDIGFVVEGEIREAAPGDDALVMIGMLRRECRWIRQGTGHG